MIKNRVLTLFSSIGLTIFAAHGVCADEPANSSEEKEPPSSHMTHSVESEIRPLIEVKLGYYFFADAKMRKIYSDGGVDVQLSGSYPIWKWLQIYGSFEFLECQGSSLNDHQKTTIWEIPLSLGLQPVIKIKSWLQYYFTLGPRYFFVHSHASSTYVDRNISQNGIGGFVNTGLHFIPTKHLILDVFGEYSYARMHFHPSKTNTYGRDVQVGGFTFGAGIGYEF